MTWFKDIIDTNDESADYIKARVKAWYLIAKFHNKFFSPDREEQVKLWEQKANALKKPGK